MKKFLAAICAAGLLFTGANVSATDDEPLQLEVYESDAKTFSVHTGSNKVLRFELSKIRKAQIDWDSAPTFNNYADLIEYLNECKNELKTVVPVRFTDGFFPDNSYVVNVRAFWHMSCTDYGDGQSMLYEITNYPGERVAYAYKHDDTSFLNDDERKLYDLAVEIINEAEEFSDDFLLQELYLHDAITKRATYFTESQQPRYARYQTAIGALIDGKANCQGYTDAFYMLAKMSGFNVDKVCGVAARRSGSQEHTWNTITFNNGSYFVDVTWNDAVCKFDGQAYNSYAYFNAPTETMTTHDWHKENVPSDLRREVDDYNYFHAEEYDDTDGEYFGTYASSAEGALDRIAERIANKDYEISRVEAPFDSSYSDRSTALDYLARTLKSDYGWSGGLNIIVEKRGNRMYYTVKAS